MPRTKTTRRRANLTADQVVADQVRALRDKRGGMSQQQLAEKLGESQSTVARIESGKRGITIANLFAIAAALNVAPLELLAASFAPTEVPVTSALRLSPPEAREWLRGTSPLPGADEAEYWTTVSADETKLRVTSPSVNAFRLELSFLEHAVLREDPSLVGLALDRLEHLVALSRESLEQGVAEVGFIAGRARKDRRGR